MINFARLKLLPRQGSAALRATRFLLFLCVTVSPVWADTVTASQATVQFTSSGYASNCNVTPVLDRGRGECALDILHGNRRLGPAQQYIPSLNIHGR
jgi:hypothetical protein